MRKIREIGSELGHLKRIASLNLLAGLVVSFHTDFI